MSLCQYRRRHSAFTLVELLVVVGIIAILIAVLLPSLMKARIQALQTMCGSNQHQIYLATVLYATDNHGYLPGTFAQFADEGAIYFQSSQYGGYPWEYKNDPTPGSGNSNNENNFGSPNNEPPDVAAAPRVEWFGVGCLVGGRYLPPTKIVECPDFVTPANVNFSYQGNFTLTNLWYSTTPPGDVRYMWTGPNTGSYILNTVPYYSTDSSNLAKGRFGPGREGGHIPQVPASQQVAHMTALIMCMSSENPSQEFANGLSYAHRGLGVNCTYIDGHTSWLPLGYGDWLYLNQLSQNGVGTPSSSTDEDLNGNSTTFWVWATRKNGI